jgi:phosphoesterase RecJ-like protein
MENFPKDKIAMVKSLLDSPKKILILSHFNPDGDALGSSLALKLFFEKLGHFAQCIYPSSYPPYYNWMPKNEESIIYSDSKKDFVKEHFDNCDIIFSVDFNAKERINDMQDFLANSTAPKIVIDHHQSPSDDFDIYFCNDKYSSACELVYEFIIAYHSLEIIDKELATCLYTGLITDTGGFQFSSTHASSHIMASHLLDAGIQAQEIFNDCFNNFSLNRLKLFGYCVANNMTLIEHKKVAFMWIDNDTKHKFNIKDGDTEGLVNHPLKVGDINVSVLFKEDKDKIRISFRSKEGVDVNQFARNHFNGGGHINAAGGSSKLPLKETLALFEKLVATEF